MKAKALSLIAGMLFMITFGIIDNVFLIIGMDMNSMLIDPHVQPLLSAMVGNTISDVLGAVAGVIVAALFVKLFKVEKSESLFVEIVGVLIGCIIPIIIFIVIT
jgi:hypothetical protein